MDKQNDDGTAELRLPGDVQVLLIHATYENSTEYFVNCDMAKQKDTPAELVCHVRHPDQGCRGSG